MPWDWLITRIHLAWFLSSTQSWAAQSSVAARDSSLTQRLSLVWFMEEREHSCTSTWRTCCSTSGWTARAACWEPSVRLTSLLCLDTESSEKCWNCSWREMSVFKYFYHRYLLFSVQASLHTGIGWTSTSEQKCLDANKENVINMKKIVRNHFTNSTNTRKFSWKHKIKTFQYVFFFREAAQMKKPRKFLQLDNFLSNSMWENT